MPDVLAVATLISFFAIAVAFVRACERIIGPDLEAEVVNADASSGEPESGQVAA
jgi:hypothetical protein